MSATFEVLAEPARRQILELLRQRERPVNELVERLELSQPGVSKHLRVLREAGLVSVRPEGQRRVYGLRAEPLAELDRLARSLPGFWGGRLDALERHLDEQEDDMTARNSRAPRRPPGDPLRAPARPSGRARLAGADRARTRSRPGWRSPSSTSTEGGRVVLTWQNTDNEGNTAVARGTVSALDPPRLLELDTDIHGRLRWELEPDGDGTLLTFTVEAQLPDEYELRSSPAGTSISTTWSTCWTAARSTGRTGAATTARSGSESARATRRPALPPEIALVVPVAVPFGGASQSVALRA